ncbi:PorT family protein [bacterium]|nr:PorT family protein [bacterium]
MKAIFLLLLLIASDVHAQMDSIATISISSNYSDASIWIDDKETGFKSPSVISGIKIGQHKVTLRWVDFQRHTEYIAEQTIVVKSADSNYFFIEFSPVSVTIVCNAENTKLFLNGQLKGEGNDLVIDRIIPGIYHLKLSQPFGVTAEKSVYFPPNSNDCPPECFVFGNLHVESDEIQDAVIFINGHQTDKKVPATFNSLIIGEYEVGVKIKGKIVSKKVIVKMNEENHVRVNPKEIAKEIKKQELAQRALKKAQKEKEEKEKWKKERLEQEQETIRLIEEKKIRNQKKEKLHWHKGVTVGANSFQTGKFKVSGITYDTDGKFGFHVGAYVAIPVENFIYIHNELRIQQRNFEVRNWWNKRLEYLQDILLIKKRLLGDCLVNVGVGVGFLLNDNKVKYAISYDLTNRFVKLKQTEFFGHLGIGLGLAEGLFVGFEMSLPESGTGTYPLNIQRKTYEIAVRVAF